ncbi:ATP-grasp domain-containing protein [Streptomyces xanthochromogenes]|uniref:ATP-grasp domain-containing protein n=1 Tax=Streptomyces xanthochromogenes TaxID=67384 RepID=UPI00342C3F88
MTAVPRAVVVIVDPVRAGIKLAQLFNGLGHRCVAVLSEESDSEFWRASFRPQDFLFTLHEADGFDALVAGLRGHEVACLVPGGESGVDLADRLTPYFPGVPALDPAMAHGRRDKFHMAELLAARGIPSIPHCRTGDVETALKWYRDRGADRVVVKPLAGTSAEGVHFCASEDEVRAAFGELTGTVSLFGRTNDELLVQSDISRDGAVEFTVNSVSSRGHHHVTDVWRMRRRMVDSTAVCVYSELVHPHEREYGLLADYLQDVLSALGIDNGTAHSEIMVTPGGPVLIETGARIEGACDPGAALTLCGRSQNSLLPASYLDPQAFEHAITAPRPVPALYARHVYLLSPVEGKVVNPPALERIRALPTFYGMDTTLDAVEVLERTVNLATCPGNLYLVSPSQERIEEDYATLREIERELYADMLAV